MSTHGLATVPGPEGASDVWVEASRLALDQTPEDGTASRTLRTSPRKRFIRRFRRQHVGIVAVGVLVLTILVAIFGPLLSPYDPNQQNLSAIFQYPSSVHWMGTDDLGRDVFARIISGTRVSLGAAIQATLIASALGVSFGLIAGYLGGATDRAIMFVTDAIMAMPGLLLAIALVGFLGPGLTNAMTAIGIVFAPRVLRIVRGSVKEVKEETYIEAARSIGAPGWRIVRQHVLRNILSPLIVVLSILLGRAMLDEASLSFLGLGAQYPQASWGAMLGRAFPYVDRAPFLLIFPGVAIAVVVLAFNVFGDALRDSLGRETREG